MEKHSNNLEKRGSKIGQVNRQLRRSYDANFKMMVINEAESSNNCQVAVKYGVTECNVRRWRTQKDRLKKAHSQRKSFRGPRSGRFQELDRRVSAYVDERRKDGRPVSRAVVQLKAVETAKELNIPNADFKASLGWCKRMMRRHGLTLRRRTGAAQRLPSDSGEKLSSSQRHVINSRKKHSYPPDQVGNADQTPVFFDMPTPVTVHEEASPQPVMCQVCGTYFETRRGLSSHARLHLRQLGVTLSESSGAPIELLYQLIQERDGSLADFKADSSTPVSTPLKNAVQQESPPSAPDDKGSSFKAAVSVTTTPQRSDHQGSPVKLKEPAATLLPSSPSSLRLIEGSSSSSAEHQTPAKPLWAPLETDAPITLDTHDEVHVCQLCGCWYETRKGLSSHARAHLRQIGIPDSDIKGSPIYFLYQIMVEGNLKPISSKQQVPPNTNSPTGSLSGRSTDLSSPPASPPVKRPKTSEDCTCVLCGEEFENRKGLASHARSHLRQMGVTDLMGKSSAINTLQELVSSGMVEAVHPPRTNSPPSSSAAPSTAPAASPAQSQSPFPSTSLTPSPAKSVHSPPTPVNRAPKAKKGFRLAVDPLHKKLKPEPVEIELSVQPKESSTISDSALEKSPSAAATSASAAAAAASKPLSAVSSTDVPSPPTVLCDFCGQLFETRKALSCHVRAHLRQLGLTWSIRTSPIDLLKEVMLHGEDGRKWSSPAGKGTWTPQGSKKATDQPQPREPAFNNCTSPLDYSLKEKSSPGKRGSTHTDTSCELCGFDFENRKALASHARAHLRQLGIIEWKADGASSPIDLLSELIRKDPAKVAAINRRYRMGDLYIKKSQRSAASPSLSTDSDTVPGGSLRPEHKAGREDSAFAAGSSRQPQGHARTLAGHTQQRGVHPPKHTVPTAEESQDTSSQQPARSGSIPALLPKPPLTPLVKLVGKVYSLKCRFCEEVFHGPVSVQEQWITHLQKHILSLGYKGKASPPAAPVEAPALVVAV